ncbi:patatin-like phospholipase family protein [Ruania albidiflava]|uniref:patatin-like phospholipase family protein n=1 Tax=Ruania albidiflava TaxID=366586 RepID=UPI0003B658E6|nr:patatin-like phospholipase family protein [Ruania albidiflava]
MSAPGPVTGLRHRLIRALGGQVPQHQGPGATALVISGGGARSSFELGALQYLYERERIAPRIITGTSAGSILAAVIAQHPDPAGQRRAVAELRHLWLDMRDSSDMFTELPWFTKLNEHMPTWRKVMALRNRSTHRARTGRLGAVLPRAIRSRTEQGAAAGHAEPTRGRHTPPAAEHRAEADTVTETETRASAEQEDSEHGLAWSVTNVLDTLSTLWEAGRTSTDLELILSGAQHERAAFTPGPIVERLTDPDLFDAAAVAASGITLRIATVALESGELRYVTESGEIRDRQDEPVVGEPRVDLVAAIRASCAIPAVFPPVRLGSEHYVDGGARESLPVEVAMTALGARHCYAVVASPTGLAHSADFGEKDMLEIVMRAGFGIMPDEILTDEVRRAGENGATIIQPELDIHDILTIDPGLTAIAMDYGWSRAAEACTGASATARARVRDVYEVRRLLWSAEDLALRPRTAEGDAGRSDAEHADTGRADVIRAGPGRSDTGRNSSGASSATAPVDSRALTEIAELKHRLRSLVDAADPALLPPGAHTWWRDFERHPYPVHAEPDWLH